MKKFFIISICLLLFGMGAYSQSAEVLTDFIHQEKATWNALTYLAYYIDTTTETVADQELLSPDETFDFFKERGFVPEGITQNSLIRLDDMSLFMLRITNVKRTSMLFSLFETRRYAFRQMQHFRLLNSKQRPAGNISGGLFVSFMGDFLTKFPNAKLVVK